MVVYPQVAHDPFFGAVLPLLELVADDPFLGAAPGPDDLVDPDNIFKQLFALFCSAKSNGESFPLSRIPNSAPF
jgi:hypothetical protein